MKTWNVKYYNQNIIGLTLNANEEVPLLSPCPSPPPPPPPMLSKFFGGKFKYLNRKFFWREIEI